MASMGLLAAKSILTPKALAGLPAVWYGAVHVDPRPGGGDLRQSADASSAAPTHQLDVRFHIERLATVLALLGTAILATATGWAASFRILGQKPLQILREE
jgi:hypothetical protein